MNIWEFKCRFGEDGAEYRVIGTDLLANFFSACQRTDYEYSDQEEILRYLRKLNDPYTMDS